MAARPFSRTAILDAITRMPSDRLINHAAAGEHAENHSLIFTLNFVFLNLIDQIFVCTQVARHYHDAGRCLCPADAQCRRVEFSASDGSKCNSAFITVPL